MPSVLFAYKPLLDSAEWADAVRILQAPRTLDATQLATSHPEAEALITLITHRIDSQVMAFLPALRVVANVAAGIDDIDVAAASRLGILICNVPGVVEETTADLTFALIISACRQLTAAEQRLRTGRWTRWELDANLGVDVHGAILGLVGFGGIGQAVARRADGFGMTVRHHTRRPTGRPGWTASLLELLENADIVSVHVPLAADTVGLIGPRELSVMKPSAVLANTSRGGIVDEEALAAALEEHRLFGAGLDVYVREPTVNPRLRRCPRIILLPHIGSATLATRRRMESRAFEAALAAVRGAVPNGAVNAESWQRR
jgi:lactate dehydrogenase-like 2-hydroxyacid dehydrogenase